MQREDYLKAGGIAAKVRERVRSKNWVGETVYDICEEVEGEIRRLGAKCAFPVNTSINEVAAHYTAEPNDPLTIKENDLVKIDLGAQVNGYIADTAVTVNYDPRYDYMVSAAEGALKAALGIAKDGLKISEMGKAIEQSVKQSGCLPISNLSGHSLDQYTIHAGKSIPNIWSMSFDTLAGSSAYACEPFVTTRDGSGFVRNGKSRNIYTLISRKNTKNKEADELSEYIWKNFNMLPFALRWILADYKEERARELLQILIKKKIVREYPVLVEVMGQKVAQAEHTFIPGENGITVTTAA